MSENTWVRDTSGLTAYAQSRKEHKRKAVEHAMATLLQEQKPINFNTVAKAAEVSKAYLYGQLDLRERIEAIRQQSLEQMVRERAASPLLREKTDASRDLVILAKDRHIKVLEEENCALKKQLQAALGKAYDQL
jgi:esterase/lipase